MYLVHMSFEYSMTDQKISCYSTLEGARKEAYSNISRRDVVPPNGRESGRGRGVWNS